MADQEPIAPAPSTDRRAFLTTGAALAAGGLMFGEWTPASAAALPKRKLGRTGLMVTTLSFGGIQLSDDSHKRVLEHAIDAGINLIHSCPGYTGGRSMKVVGDVMKTKRKSVYLAIKASPGDVDRCLQTLNTDVIDILIPDSADFSDKEKEAYAKLQKAGKIRFSGFACHNGMAKRLEAAIDAGWRDVMLISYNAGNRGGLDDVIAKAVKAQKMGFMAMKVRAGGDFGAGLRSLLKNDDIHTLTPGMNSVQQIDANIAAVTQRNADTRREDREFARYCSTLAGKLCTHCGHCDQACPQRVAIGEYLRADLYRERGDLRLAQDLVRSIPRRQSVAACTRCGRCDHACERQLSVMDLIHDVARV